MAYSEKVVDHYENPRNVGSLDPADNNVGTGLVGAPECGDVMKLQIKVDDEGIITDAKFKTFGCGSAIAASSLATEWVNGKSVDDALKLDNTQIVEELSLPPVKIHCSVLAEDAIKSAINDYKSKGLNFKIKSPIGFINTFANSPNIIRLWRKENASKNDDPWIYILILNEKIYDDEKEFKKELINGGALYLANQVSPNSSNVHYFSVGNYPGVIFDFNPPNGEKSTVINLYLQNHLIQFWYASRAKLNENEFDRYRNILIAFAKSIKFL